MKFHQISIVASIVFLSGFAQLASASGGPKVTLVNQLGNQSYLVMNYDVIASEEDIKNIEMLGHLVSYQETQSFNDFQRMDAFSFTQNAGVYPDISGNYIYAGLGSATLTPDFSCQNLVARFNPTAKNITITVKKSVVSSNQISCVVG